MTDWETRYYEQQALHTESNGMLTQERNALLKSHDHLAVAYEKLQYTFADLRADYDDLRKDEAQLRVYADHQRRLLRDLRSYLAADSTCLSNEDFIQRIDAALEKNPNPAGRLYPEASEVSSLTPDLAITDEASGAGGAGTLTPDEAYGGGKVNALDLADALERKAAERIEINHEAALRQILAIAQGDTSSASESEAVNKMGAIADDALATTVAGMKIVADPSVPDGEIRVVYPETSRTQPGKRS